MRAAVRIIPLFAPNVEIRIAATTSVAPSEPMVTLAASEATSADTAIAPGPSTYANATLASTNSTITMTVERMIDRGRLRPGFTISLPTYVVSIQPSYAHSTATIATPNAPIQWPTGSDGHSGWKCDTDPPRITKEVTTKSVSAPIFSVVSTFCVVAPSRTPRQLRTVRPMIDRIAMMRIPDSDNGVKNPMYFANPTAIAVIDAVLMTEKFDQPYRKAHTVPYASRRYAYWPPASGYAAASSATESAP